VRKGSQTAKPCLISCSVLKGELTELKSQKELNANVVFVSKNFHVDYGLLEKNLRRTIERTLTKLKEKPILVYGDLCLGPNGEMKQLAEEYGLVKVDALNCIDCILGGHGKIEEADPNHEYMFFDPGMIDFFLDAQKKLDREGMTHETLKNMFSGIKGVIILDILGNAEKCKAEIEKLDLGLQVLETKEVGVSNLNRAVSEAIHRSRQKTK
jgi:Protein of unknown function (DUF1638)